MMDLGVRSVWVRGNFATRIECPRPAELDEEQPIGIRFSIAHNQDINQADNVGDPSGLGVLHESSQP